MKPRDQSPPDCPSSIIRDDPDHDHRRPAAKTPTVYRIVLYRTHCESPQINFAKNQLIKLYYVHSIGKLCQDF